MGEGDDIVCSHVKAWAGARFRTGMSVAPHLDSRFDGDIMNFTVVLTTEAINEIKAYLDSAAYYVDIKGNMNFSSENDISNLVFLELSE